MLGMLRHGLRSRSCIIDGEAVACDDNGVASFDLVRHQRANESIFLYAFDLIELNGDDLRRDPLEVRKATLAPIVAKASPGIRFNEHMDGDGPTVFPHACKLGLEGVVSKRKDSAYRSGRSPDWLKMKCGARFDSQRCNSSEIFVARPLKFSHMGNSGLKPYSGLGNQLSRNRTRLTSWGLAIMERRNGTLRWTGRIAEADSDLHRRSNRKDRARRGGCIRPGDHRGIYQVACAACRASRA